MKVYLFLDFDGTLAPIADTPRQAVLPPAAKRVLRRLSRHPLFKVAIISGRALDDLRRRVGLEGIVYAGNHGFEVAGPGLSAAVRIGKRTKALLKKVHAALAAEFSGIPGILVEDKGASVSFHYRLAARGAAARAKKRFAAVMSPYLRRRELAVRPGKMVLEITPPAAWDKGRAVLHILAGHRPGGFLPVFIGDDTTDETAFRALRGRGITIHVGNRRKTAARFRLKDTDAVLQLLQELERLPAGQGE